MPPLAGAVDWVFAGEQYTSVKLAGAALTLAGVAVAQFSGRTVREAPAPVD
jgi:drug/metabolite transporter (DMT)-like permease